MRIFVVVISLLCIGLIVALIMVLYKPEAMRFDRQQLVGEWIETTENERLTLKDDSTFTVSITGSGQNFQGSWTIDDLYYDNDTTSLLVLKNSVQKEYDREDYFAFYFFQIEKLDAQKLTMLDLSGTLRRNRINTFKRKK